MRPLNPRRERPCPQPTQSAYSRATRSRGRPTRTRDVNLFAPVATAITGGGQSYTFERFPTARPISRATGQSYNRISVFESVARNVYNGLAFQATRRFTRVIPFTESMRQRLMLEAFNISNRANVVTVNNTVFNLTGGVLVAPSAATAFGTPRTFSSPASGTTTFATPRQLQLGVKFDF